MGDQPKICGAFEPQGRGRCGLYAPHPTLPHRLLRSDHPKDEARAFQKVEWTIPPRYQTAVERLYAELPHEHEEN